MKPHADLTATARELAAAAAPGSIERRASGCAAVALATTSTIQAARKALGSVWPAEVQSAALAVLGELERSEAEGALGDVQDYPARAV